MNKKEDYYDQIKLSIDLLTTLVSKEDLTPFDSYVTAIGELTTIDDAKYQLQMRIVKMECRLSMEDNGYRKEEITKIHE